MCKFRFSYRLDTIRLHNCGIVLIIVTRSVRFVFPVVEFLIYNKFEYSPICVKEFTRTVCAQV